jgi:hypothetical protein
VTYNGTPPFGLNTLDEDHSDHSRPGAVEHGDSDDNHSNQLGMPHGNGAGLMEAVKAEGFSDDQGLDTEPQPPGRAAAQRKNSPRQNDKKVCHGPAPHLLAACHRAKTVRSLTPALRRRERAARRWHSTPVAPAPRHVRGGRGRGCRRSRGTRRHGLGSRGAACGAGASGSGAKRTRRTPRAPA